MTCTFKITEEQRQIALLALAELSLRRPGWDSALFELAGSLGGPGMYDSFKLGSSDDRPIMAGDVVEVLPGTPMAERGFQDLPLIVTGSLPDPFHPEAVKAEGRIRLGTETLVMPGIFVPSELRRIGTLLSTLQSQDLRPL